MALFESLLNRPFGLPYSKKIRNSKLQKRRKPGLLYNDTRSKDSRKKPIYEQTNNTLIAQSSHIDLELKYNKSQFLQNKYIHLWKQL